MKKTKKMLLIGLCTLACGIGATVSACSDGSGKKLSDVKVSYGEALNVAELFGAGDTFENAKLTDKKGNRIMITSEKVTMYTLGEFKLSLKKGYHKITVADTTAPIATANMYNAGVGEQAEIVLNVYDNMDKTVENVSYQLYYGTETVAVSENMTFTPEKVGAYRFDVTAQDATGNTADYSFTFTVDVDLDRLVEAGTTVTIDDSLFDGVVADKSAYEFSYEITRNTLNRETEITGTSFVVEDTAAVKVNAIATEKANANNKIILPYTYHTDNIVHAHYLGEQANTSAFLVNDALGLYSRIGTQENGRKTFEFGFTGSKIDSRGYLTISGFEPNTSYEYMSFDITAKAPQDNELIIAMYPTQEMGKRQEYIAITQIGTRRVVVRNQKTDENGILRLFAYFFQPMDITISNLQLYKEAEMSVTTELNGYAFTLNPGGAQMDAETSENKLTSYWYSEPVGGDRPGWSISGLEAGETYDVSIDVDTNIDTDEEGNPDVNTVFYYSDTAKGNDHYGFLTERKGELKRTFVFQQLVADENGVVSYDGIYIKNGVINNWSNLKVTKHNTASTTYGTGANAVGARFELLNSAERQEMVHPHVTSDGKLGVDVGKGSLGNMQGARPQLVLTGLKAGKSYDVTVKAEISGHEILVAPYYTQTSKGNDHYGVYTEAGVAEWTGNFKADASGEIVFGAWYIGAWSNVTFTEITAVEELPPMGNYNGVGVMLTVVNSTCDKVNTSVLDNKYVIALAKANSTQSGIGNDRKNGNGAALTFSGLQANTAYTIDFTFDMSFTDSEQTTQIMIFTKDGTTTTSNNCFKFVEGTTGTKDSGATAVNTNVNGNYTAGTYVIRLTGTTDANGTVSFTGWYMTGTTTVLTVTGVTATAN